MLGTILRVAAAEAVSLAALAVLLLVIGRGRVKRLIRCARLLSRDPRVPRWAKVAFTVSLLPIPGPFDEVMGGCVAGVLWLTNRALIREAWAAA